jgi:uncharacterized protein (DUF983 family)
MAGGERGSGGGLGAAIGRGLRRRCPRCASKGIFESYLRLKDACPTCGYPFERESGYWVGAIVINMAVAEVVFFVLFVTVVLLTMPGVEWGPLLIVAIGTNAVLPVIFYPLSKTLWMAVDLHFHRYKEEEAEVVVTERSTRI